MKQIYAFDASNNIAPRKMLNKPLFKNAIYDGLPIIRNLFRRRKKTKKRIVITNVI
jgi:hypothetical protein